MEATIRAAAREDVPRLAEAWTEFGRYYAALEPTFFREPAQRGLEAWVRKGLEEEPDPDVAWLVADVSGTIEGYVQAKVARPDEDAPWQLLRDMSEPVLRINALFVFEAQRRQGIGSLLMGAVEAWARSRGATRSFLNTYDESPSAVPFYGERAGYERMIVGFWKQL